MTSYVDISIIVPIYNVDTYLYQCINSIVNQSFKNIEIILVNDASTDHSLHICEYFRKNDDRVIIIDKKQNEGLVSARKTGIEKAIGRYAMYVDADDWISIDYLKEIYGLVTEYNAEAVFPSHIREFLGNEKTIKNKINSDFYDRREIKSEILPRMLSFGKFFSHGITSYSWGKLFQRRKLLEFQSHIPDNIIMGEDAALTFSILPKLKSIYITDIAGYYYRQRPGSILKEVNDYEIEAHKLSSLFQFLRGVFFEYPLEYNFAEQLEHYVYALSLMRIGSQFSKENNSMLDLLNHQGLRIGIKLCLYSSGSFGQNIYKNLIQSKNYQIVGWVDEDHKESQMCGLEVSNVDEILNIDFDYVFIAALDPVAIEKAKKKLIRLGVPKEIISNIHFQKDLIRQNIESLGFCSESYRVLD
jgi:glycosyltransferase involved in cell wall biosynthesis